MSANPVFQFFTSPPNVGPLLMRVFLTAVTLVHVLFQCGVVLPAAFCPSLFQWVEGYSAISIAGMIFLEAFLSVFLLLGLFTRLAAMLLFLLICLGLPDFYRMGDWDAWNASIALAVICLGLVSLGGGRFSLDRGISRQILPEIG